MERRPAQIPYISNVTGTWISEEEIADPTYWSRHLRGAVRFAHGMETLLEQPARVFLEVGPGHALQIAAKSVSADAMVHAIFGSIRHPKAKIEDDLYLARTLGALWANGAAVDWTGYYGDEPRYRVSMPGYPFEHKRYLIEPAQSAHNAVQDESGPMRRKSDIADWFYVPTWKGTPAASLQAAPNADPADSTWVLFMDELGAAERIAARLESMGLEPVRVHPGEAYTKSDGNRYTIEYASKEHYASLFQELRKTAKGTLRVLHLWNVTQGASATTLADIDAAERRGYFGPLHLGQALSEYSGQVRLVMVSNGLQDLSGAGGSDPAKSLLIGPCRLINKECSNVDCRSVDIAIANAEGMTPLLIGELLAEPLFTAPGVMVAYRGGARWIESFESVRMEATTSPFGAGHLREGGAYLLTGGLGGLGLAVARHLAQTVRARLILVGRSELPPRAEWERWLADHHYSDATSLKIRGLIEVEAAGGELLILPADVADTGDMRRVIVEGKARFGRIDGVFHIAGVPGGSLIPLTTREHSDAVLRPKVRGTLALAAALAGEDPDFMVLFSSLNATLAGAGQVAYTAANMFLEGYATRQQALGRNVVSIGWDAWSEVGMNVGFESRTAGGVHQKGGQSPVAHGLLKWVQDDGDAQVFSTSLSGAEHWALGEHLVVDKPTLVGTAYIDMAVSAALHTAPGSAVELSNVYILSPLTIGESERKSLELVVSGVGEQREFAFRSRRQTYGEEAEWQEHAMGSVRRATLFEPMRQDLAAIRQRCAISSDVQTHVGAATANISFGRRWATLIELGVGQDEALACLELPEEYADECGSYAMHPAVLDVATSFAKRYASSGFFLPISYKRIAFARALPRRIYSHIRFDADAAVDRELITFDISLLDDEGRELVAIEGYSLKRVPDSFFEQQGASTDAAKALRASGAEDRGMSTAEGIEVMRRILDRALSPRLLISRFDLVRRTARSYVKTERGVNDGRLNVKKAKAQHKRPKIKTAYVEPRNELEEQVAEIWQGILGIDQVGVNDGFLDLGGNSLLAVQVISRLREAFEVELPLEMLYRSPTVAGIAEGILALMLEGMGEDELPELLDAEARS